MLTNLDPQAALFMADVARIQQRITEANSQVTSGKRVMLASDAPDQISALLQLRADRQRNTQIQSNMALANTDATAGDDALASAIRLMDSAVTLAAQGASSTTDPSSRMSLAQQIRGIRQQMVSTSQTSVQGRFIFSGDGDATASYRWDETAAGAVVKIASTPSTRLIEDPAGGTFSASKTAQEIFDDQDLAGTPTTYNVFNALGQLQVALQNNDTAGITDSITLLKAASEHLNSMQAFYGNVQARIANASDFSEKYDVQLQTEISQKEDADITTAALEMMQANTQLQAAFQMRAQVPHRSLFDYLG
jgi:flagellar hook-associated protein 3 FlgL